MLLQGAMSARWLDESDCAGVWESETMAAVLFPSGDTLSSLRHLDADAGGQRLILCINPQWQLDGQVISDFGCAHQGLGSRLLDLDPELICVEGHSREGCVRELWMDSVDSASLARCVIWACMQDFKSGMRVLVGFASLLQALGISGHCAEHSKPSVSAPEPYVLCCSFGRSKKEAEQYIRGFKDVYYLRRMVLCGDDVRVLHAYSGDWQVRYPVIDLRSLRESFMTGNRFFIPVFYN